MKYVSLALLALSISAGPALAAGQAAPDTASHADQTHANHTPAKPADSSKAFAGFELNKDGKLSAIELAKHPMVGHMSMVDADKDGSLDATEFSAFEKM